MKVIFILLVLVSSVLPQTAQVKEVLPDKSLIIEFEGVEYRALTAEKIRSIMVDKEDLRLTKESFSKLEERFSAYRDVAENYRLASIKIEKLETEKVIGERDFWKTQYESEKKLRLKFESNMKSCSGKVLFVRFCLF